MDRSFKDILLASVRGKLWLHVNTVDHVVCLLALAAGKLRGLFTGSPLHFLASVDNPDAAEPE